MFIAESIWQEDVDPFFLNPLEKSLYHSPNSAEIHAYNPKSLFPVKKKKAHVSVFIACESLPHPLISNGLLRKQLRREFDPQRTRCA